MTMDEVLDRYDDWTSYREHHGTPGSPSRAQEWINDTAIELLDALVDTIRYGDEDETP